MDVCTDLSGVRSEGTAVAGSLLQTTRSDHVFQEAQSVCEGLEARTQWLACGSALLCMLLAVGGSGRWERVAESGGQTVHSPFEGSSSTVASCFPGDGTDLLVLGAGDVCNTRVLDGLHSQHGPSFLSPADLCHSRPV